MYIFLYVFCLALTFLIPESANASNIFEPSSGSLAIPVLDALFGKLSGGGLDAFSSVITVFNSAVLIIAGLLAGYTILAGTIGTAHDGEMLGKKFSSVWIPIRYSVFTALMLPIVGGGYCAMQAIVYWLIVQGIGLADQSWASYVSTQNITQSVSAGITRPSTKQFTYKLLETLTCQSVISKTFTKYGEEGKLLDGGSDFGMSVNKGTLNTVYSWGDKNETGQFSKDSCGSITVKNVSAPTVQSSNFNIFFNVNEAVGRMVNINKEHQNQVATLITQLQPLADGIATGKLPDVKAIDDLSDRYEEAVRIKAAEEIQQMDAFKNLSKNASQDGFLTAGAFFLPISYMADMVQRSVADVPTASGPGSMNISIAQDQWEPVQISLQKLYAQSGEMITSRTTFGTDNQAGKNNGWWETMKDTVMSGLDVSKLVDKAFSSTTDFIIIDGENPIMAMKRMGGYLFGVASTAYIALTALTATVGNAPGIGQALSMAVLLFVTPVIVAGFLLSYVFPFAPFLIWIGAITGYFLLVVEAIIAAPLWAMVHLSPDGNDMVGSGKQGYKLVLSLLLRPVLMIFGLIAALVLTQVLGDVLNRLFSGVFIMSQSDSGVLIKVFGYLVAAPIMYGAMMYGFINKMFSVITHLPDELLNWIGGGGPQLGKFADDMGGDRSHAFIAAAAVSRSVGSGAENQRNSLKGGMQETPDNKSGFKTSLNEAMNKEAKNPSEDGGGYSQSKVDSQLSNISETLGDEENNDSFEKSFQNNMESKPNATVMENMNSAFSRQLNHKFGRGTGESLKEVSGGSFAGAEFSQAVQSYKSAQTNLDAAGYEAKSIRSMIGDANNSARDEYLSDNSSVRNGGEKNLNSFLENHLGKLGTDSESFSK